MFEKIVEFIQILRTRDIRISISESRDALKSISISPEFLKNPSFFRQILATTLIKDPKDKILFDQLFNQYFLGDVENRLENYLRWLQDSIQQNRSELTEEGLKGFSIPSLLDDPYSNTQLGDSIQMEEEDSGRDLDPQPIGAGSQGRSRKISQLFSQLRREELMRLDQQEFEQYERELRDLIKELGKKIASKLTARYGKGKKILDFRKTIHENIKHGGALIKIRSKEKKVARPRLLGLIDISDSCQMYYFFMFYLIYLIKKQFSHVRVYEFDSDLLDISSALEKDTIEEVRKEIVKIWQKSEAFKTRNFMKSHSNYDTVLEQFLEKASPIITKKTTILILGDCRDYLGVKNKSCDRTACSRGCIIEVPNGRCREKDGNCQFCNCKQVHNYPRSAEHLKTLARKAKQVIILNPENRTYWNIGDSVAYCYEGVGAEVYPVNDLESLAELVYHTL